LTFKVVDNIEYNVIISTETILENSLWYLFPRKTDPERTVVKPKRKLSDSSTRGYGHSVTSESRQTVASSSTNGTDVFPGCNLNELNNTSSVCDVSPHCPTQTIPAIHVRKVDLPPSEALKP